MYILPNKDLLKDNKLENKNYYNLSDLIFHRDFKNKLVIPLGRNEKNISFYTNLKNHKGILISGETGSGKSIFIHSIIISLLLKNTPKDINFILISKNKVELNNYNFLPHLYTNIACNNIEILKSFKIILNIIKERREKFKKEKVKDIDEYNKKINDKLSEIIVIADEIGDLIDNDDFQSFIKNILKDGYKYGIHLIIATSSYLKEYQSNNLINLFDYVITFDLSSREQANYIKIKGADLLKAEGDILIKCPDNETYRLQTPYISLDNIESICNFIKNEK